MLMLCTYIFLGENEEESSKTQQRMLAVVVDIGIVLCINLVKQMKSQYNEKQNIVLKKNQMLNPL